VSRLLLTKITNMKKLFSIIAMTLCTTISAQETTLNLSPGVLEQSNKLGLGIASTIGLNQDILGNTGVGVDYTYAALRGRNFQQSSANVYHKVNIAEGLTLRPNAGVAKQISGGLYPSFGLDIMVSVGDRAKVVLGWTPVIRGHFRDAETGWSMVTGMGVEFGL
jgi:hypothetical protein